ncbi:MAG: ABC transporter ATP-binding protein [Saprospiraceae bacterium]|nr:ABC transporter ATP-binding protein [Saprospiraceae bacterium]
MKPIIEVNHVWKEYQKGIDRKYKSLRDTIAGMPGRWLGEDKEKFWALEEIDFKVEAGESVGIIGRNGAGKSTLLKILSRITPPTKGEIILRGRVASLLEVGTGFHPELTGRENVFFNGSILGMKHAEIKRKFDEIVDFSGVESFIDTPLKHYSSGMQMRLAFSVAAHLDAEILLIDEVLAVGDAEFQKKCIGKMDDVSKGEGKTILFVSHELKKLVQICKIGIYVDNGMIKMNDNLNKSIQLYIGDYQKNRSKDKKTINLNESKYLKSFSTNQNQFIIYFKQPPSEKISILIGVNDIYGNRIFNIFKHLYENIIEKNCEVTFNLNGNTFIKPDQYILKIVIFDTLENVLDENSFSFFIDCTNKNQYLPKNYYGNLFIFE